MTYTCKTEREYTYHLWISNYQSNFIVCFHKIAIIMPLLLYNVADNKYSELSYISDHFVHGKPNI